MDKKEDYSIITQSIVRFINNIYKISKYGYNVIPLLLIITSIVFIFLYTYHSLYRVNRKLFIPNKNVEYAFDSKRNIPKIVFYVITIVVILGLLILYFKIDNFDKKDLFASPLAIYFLALCPIIFVLAVIGFFIFQSKIITFADSKDMKNGILACGIIIYFCIFNMFIYSNKKIDFNESLMYIFGFFIVFTIIHFIYLLSMANTLTIQMRSDKFDTLSKICLLGKKNTIETIPYKKGKKKCECVDESFKCLVENYDSFISNFSNIEEQEHFSLFNKNQESGSMESVKADANKIPEEEYIKNIFEDNIFKNNMIAEEEDNMIAQEEDKIGEDLKYMYDVPIEYYNNNTQQYEDLCIRDFYYLGSYYSYLASSPENGTPSLDALKGVLQDFNCRIIHLDIYSSLPDAPYSSAANPIVKCEKMNTDAKGLQLEDCLKLINKYAWNDNEKSLPLFLYLRFRNVKKNKYIYQKTYQYIDEYLGKYLVDKIYGFNERNHLFPISGMPMKEAFGKAIILTNIYPTYTILDEIINCNVEDKLSSIKMNEFKKDYIIYDERGLLIDYTKDDLIKNNRKNINFYYTLPNSSYKDDAKSQSKAGLFNPNFNEIAKYGGQSALNYVYVPDNNIENTLKFFKSYPKEIILKAPFLRFKNVKEEIVTPPSTNDLTAPTETKAAISTLVSYNPTFG
jgi:hypothetical protein